MLIAIRKTGEIVLRDNARPLTSEEIVADSVQELIASMFETMRDAPGVGLAAPQIGIPLQLAVIEDTETDAERARLPVAPHVIVNPVLTLEGPRDVPFFEGCLSLPGFAAIVPRALRVRVDCLNERGEPVTIRAEGWYARILQHEIDHLNGILYIDRMISRSFTTRENLEQHWKQMPIAEIVRLLGA